MGWADTMAVPPLAPTRRGLSRPIFINMGVLQPIPHPNQLYNCKSEPLQKPEVSWTRQLQFCGAELLTPPQQGALGVS